ncbi:MAG: Brp/Blh family beta-carotene 15,15'-dioxygenase [Phaeodactylibacter sp.]|nr:Brp/Blh family beta-carotene 15,15'-dioxygenase [Phaeodactylibacter sp.]
MTARYPILFRTVQALALLAVLSNLVAPQILAQGQLMLALGLILLFGIPHGATDYLIFRYLARPLWGSRALLRFYANYLALMAAYSLLWLLLPGAALLIFLALSMYHFGQSNWNYVSFGRKAMEYGAYLLWGMFAVLGPVLWHYDAASGIIASIIGAPAPAISREWRQAVVLGLFIINLFLALYLWGKGKLGWRALQDEAFNLFILGLLFLYTPLLVGFALYFAGWHSLSSVMDQMQFFRLRQPGYSLKHYVRNSLPLSLAAVAALGGLLLLQGQAGQPFPIGAVFIFISVVTLPHMVLIDRLYEEWPSGETTDHSPAPIYFY